MLLQVGSFTSQFMSLLSDQCSFSLLLSGQFQSIVAFAITAGDVFRISPFVVVGIVQLYRHRAAIADFMRNLAIRMSQIPSDVRNAWNRLRSKEAFSGKHTHAGHRGTMDGSLRVAMVSGRQLRMSERADAFVVPLVGRCGDVSDSSASE